MAILIALFLAATADFSQNQPPICSVLNGSQAKVAKAVEHSAALADNKPDLSLQSW